MPSEASWYSSDPATWRQHVRPNWETLADMQHPPPNPVLPADTQRAYQRQSSVSSKSAYRAPDHDNNNSNSHAAESRHDALGFVVQAPALQEPAAHLPSGPHHNLPPTLTALQTGISPQTSVGPWRSLHHDDRRESVTYHPEVPLTLHNPMVKDSPQISHAGDARSASHVHPQHQADHVPLHKSQTSLPSFASFQAHASRFEDTEVEGPEIAPMSSRLACDLCTKLQPMVHEVASAVAELDESIQSYCSGTVKRALDFPQDNPVRAIHWILDRLRYARLDVQAASVRKDSLLGQRQQQHDLHSSHLSPHTNPAKRNGDWDTNDFPVPKRPRSGASAGRPVESHSAINHQADRRASIDFGLREGSRPGYSPPPPDSAAPGSVYVKQGSPPFASLHAGAIPSPASLAYLPSGAPSFAAPTAPSIGSPATSYIPPSSIHTASTSSATSQHIADLQHQVTLKSLALQTLQSEYASMLQKLQRERVKSQTIEKKTSVADQEVNELTGKAEDLSEQVKNLEMQLEESEKKREADRESAAKDKEQWGRMLEMDGKIHARNAAEKQRIAEERDALQRRLDAIDGGEQPKMAQEGRQGNSSALPATGKADDVTRLENEVAELTLEVNHLLSALKQVKDRNDALQTKLQDVVVQSGDVKSTIDATLASVKVPSPSQSDQHGPQPAATAATNNGAVESHDKLGESKPAARPTLSMPQLLPDTVMNTFRPLANYLTPVSPNPPNKSTPTTNPPTPNPFTAMKALPFAASTSLASPSSLGFDIQPTTSTPEELIQALGPVPAPLPPFRYKPLPAEAETPPTSSASRQQHHSSPYDDLPRPHLTPIPTSLPTAYPSERLSPHSARSSASSASHHSASSPAAGGAHPRSAGGSPPDFALARPSPSGQSPEESATLFRRSDQQYQQSRPLVGEHHISLAPNVRIPSAYTGWEPSNTSMPPPPRPPKE